MSVYFDSSIFLAVLNGETSASEIRELLKELQRDHIKIYTSIVTVQEVSVDCYRNGTKVRDHHGQVKKLSRISGIIRDIALTAAKLEANILDAYKNSDEKSVDSKRRKWDCFHIATAQHLGCSCLYSLDDGMLKRKTQLRVKNLEFEKPRPSTPPLFKRNDE